MDNYELHGGVHIIKGNVGNLNAHGGVYYLYGTVMHMVRHGGVVYDHRIVSGNRIEYRTDKITDQERCHYNERISQLEQKLAFSQRECILLQNKLNKIVEQKGEVTIPSDDVLIQRIEHLQSELSKERAERKRDVSELKERLDVALEINAKLRRATDREIISENIADKHVDILASLMALYPFTPDKDLVLEFNIPADRIREVARVLNVIKSPDARREAVEYLRKQHIEFIQRRGGDRSKSNKKAGKNKTKKK